MEVLRATVCACCFDWLLSAGKTCALFLWAIQLFNLMQCTRLLTSFDYDAQSLWKLRAPFYHGEPATIWSMLGIRTHDHIGVPRHLCRGCSSTVSILGLTSLRWENLEHTGAMHELCHTVVPHRASEGFWNSAKTDWKSMIGYRKICHKICHKS
jgi:hypothetical protein